MSSIEAISLADLPRVSARDLAVSRRVARAIAWLPQKMEADVPVIGRLRLAYAGVASDDWLPADQVGFSVWRMGRAGHLVLDLPLANGLVAAILDSPGPPMLRGVGAGERGLVAGILEVLLRHLGTDVSLSLAPASSRPRGLPLAIDVSAGPLVGRAMLEAPAAWFAPQEPEEGWRLRAGMLTVPAGIEVAATKIPLSSLMALEPGDAVVFDGVRRLRGDEDVWSVHVTIGDHGAPGTLAQDGRLTVNDGFSQLRTPLGDPGILAADPGSQGPDGKESFVPTPTIDTSVQVKEVLAAAPVEVTAEIGRVVLRGEEVLALAPGAVLTLGGSRSTHVTLRVGDEVWADGELVDVDGELGVRVTRLRRPTVLDR